MDQLTNIVRVGLSNYFTKLTSFGYVNYSHVDALLIAIYIEEVLNNPDICLTEQEYNTFEQVLYILFKEQCLLPYPLYYNNVQTSANDLIVKLTEADILRFDEGGLIKKT